MFHHRIHPLVNAVTQILPVKKIKADIQGVIFGRPLPLLPVMLRDGAAGLVPDLQCPDNALFVPQVQLLRCCRVDAPQLLQQRLHALLPGPALQLPPQLRALRAGGKIRPPDQGVQIEARTAHQHRQLVPPQDILHTRVCRVHIPGRRPTLRRVSYRHHVVGYPLHLLLRGCGGTDGHAPVELHGIHADHLAVKAFGQCHAHFRFSRGGRPHHAKDCRHALSPVFLMPS